MRIIAGIEKGRKLIAPLRCPTRPTGAKVKESIFNIIQNKLPCKKVLDLFAGTGALGLEALSRGAKEGYFVENNKKAFSVLKKNVSNVQFDDHCKIFCMDAILYLKINSCVFDIIFLDPPYNGGILDEVMEIIYKKRIVSDGGVVVVESKHGCEIFNKVPAKKFKYGNTVISIFWH